MTNFPQVPLLDFIIYVLSSLGTWFGLVIMSCNPIELIKSRVRQNDENETSETRSSNRLQTLRRRNLIRNRFYSQYHNN